MLVHKIPRMTLLDVYIIILSIQELRKKFRSLEAYFAPNLIRKRISKLEFKEYLLIFILKFSE